MNTIANSPFWASMFTIVVTGAVGVVTLLVRLITRLTRIEESVRDLGEAFDRFKNDDNIVRWSHLRPGSFTRRRRGN